MKLQIQAYFFNAKTDYLPYYKNFSLEVNADNPIAYILPMIKEQNRNFSYPEENLYFKINGLIVNGKETIQTIVNRLGVELCIDPISSYRSENGLIINDDDFMQSFELLSAFTSDEDKKFYQSLYAVHYGSETFNYNNQYIGDAILILAHKMINDGNPNKAEILDIISEHHDGLWECEYDNNLFQTQDFSTQIAYLKSIAKGNPSDSITSKISALFSRKHKENEIASLEDKRVAFYAGDSLSTELVNATHAQILNKGATLVTFAKATKLAGQSLLGSNNQMAYLKAGTMLLDAIDSGANLLVVSKDEDMKMLKSNIGHCEKVLGRDIHIDMISRTDLLGLRGKSVA